MNYLKSKKEYILDVFIIFIGTIIASLGVNLFLSHVKLLSGGATGIALIIQYITGIKAGYSVFLINLPLFVISYFKLDKKFTVYSAIGMTCLSISLLITEPLGKMFRINNDILLNCIYGGILCGLGYGLVFSRNGSTGGTDFITMLIKKKYSNFNIGSVGFALNFIIVGLGAFLFGVTKSLYTLISMFIQGFALNKVIRGVSHKNLLFILTEKEDLVIDYVMNNLHRGITSLSAEGEYTHSKKKMLYCILTPRQMVDLKFAIHRIDPKAFITVVDVSEVKGKGFANNI